jgi:hypothetical protein
MTGMKAPLQPSGASAWPNHARSVRQSGVGSHQDEMPAASLQAFMAGAGASGVRKLGYA